MKIHHIAISVKDLEKSLRFYKEILGLIEVNRFDKKSLAGRAVLLKLNSDEDIHLELWQSDKPIKNKDDFSNLDILGIKHIAFEVDSVEEKYKELKSKGIEVSEPKEGASCVKYCFLKDPDGFPLELYEK